MRSIEAGKEVILTRLSDMATRLGVVAESVEWGPPEFDLESGLGMVAASETAYPLAIMVRGRRTVAKFSEAELEECAKGEENRSIIQSRLFRAVSPRQGKRTA